MDQMSRPLRRARNVSRAYQFDSYDAAVVDELIEKERSGKLGEMMVAFDKYHERLTDYGFWYILSVCWARYSDYPKTDFWIEHFSSPRSLRELSIMKPNEQKFFRTLPETIRAYRGHWPGETRWVAYTLDLPGAHAEAARRGASMTSVYEVPRSAVIAYLNRRGERQLIVPDQSRVNFVGHYSVGETEMH